MDIKQLDNWSKNIQVRNMEMADVEVVNNSPLVMMGKGRQGAVFQVSNDICIKVFGNPEDCEREYYALSLGQNTNLFPRVYAKGSLYITMEIVKGIDLREYLQSQPLTPELSSKLVEMLITFKEIGFERIDHHKRQIYVQPDGNLKVIDVARTVWRDRVYPYPRKLLISLGEENKQLFLSHVQTISPQLYNEWLHYIHMEEQSRKIYQILLSKKLDEKGLKSLSEKLLTTKNNENYTFSLKGLLHKVLKEEWVKVMLARGYNPDKVMEKIDKYWDEREQSVKLAQENHYGGDKYRDEDKKRDKDKSDGSSRYDGVSQHHSEKHLGKERRFVGEKQPNGVRRFY